MKGAVIQRVQPGSPAEDAGLQPGEVIVSVNRHADAERFRRPEGPRQCPQRTGRDGVGMGQWRQYLPRAARRERGLTRSPRAPQHKRARSNSVPFLVDERGVGSQIDTPTAANWLMIPLTKQEAGMAHCTKCGAELPDTAQFCQKCGQPQSAPQPGSGFRPATPPYQPARPASRRMSLPL